VKKIRFSIILKVLLEMVMDDCAIDPIKGSGVLSWTS
jgi:hypothetical protein